MKDVYLERMLSRQPADVKQAMVLFDYKNMGPDTSSPHIVSREWIKENLAWNAQRQMLLSSLDAWLAEIRRTGVEPELMMLGGSFVSFKDTPKDIDGLLLYSAGQGADLAAFNRLAAQRQSGLDMRVVPHDAGPVLLIKTVCFYHTLYQGRQRPKGRGSIIVGLE